MEVSKKDGGFLFDNRFFFTLGEKSEDKDIITLKSHIGKDMNYQVSIKNLIEYPGVYDFDDLHILCEGKNDLLNFVVQAPKVNFAIVQDVNSIDADNYEDVKDAFLINELQLNKFLKLDIDINTVDLESIS